jgi:PTH1 family peptidyl-tRNA hydrolase
MKYLIVGLGNKGAEYAETRHNIGFKVVDELANAASVSFQNETLAHIARIKYKGKQLILVKPTTYMNLSGKAVNYWMQKEKIDKTNLLVIVDDLNFDFGTVRLKPRGSDGGHNGLKDIQAVLNGTEYPRLRVGISRPEQKGVQVDYVLGEWSEEENKQLNEIISKSADAIKKFISLGISLAMNEINK